MIKYCKETIGCFPVFRSSYSSESSQFLLGITNWY